MYISSVICEYNPFHNGHKYLLDRINDLKATHKIAIMSGNFTQRGDASILSKWDRARIAVMAGINLVIELPLPYAVSTAEKFAEGSIYILNQLHCVDNIVFGSECGDISILKSIANELITNKFSELIKKYISQGITFAKARELALNEVNPNMSEIIKTPNNILGIEYLKALNKYNSDITPYTITRKNVSHNSTKAKDNYASASYIRKLILEGDTSFFDYIPQLSYDIINNALSEHTAPTILHNAERAILYRLRNMTLEEISKLPDISEGIENRIYKAVQKAKSLDELYNIVKTKRYSHARIRRIILSAFLGILKEYTQISPQYIRVLAFDKKGTEILKIISEKSSLPIITKLTKFNGSNIANKLINLENKADDIYSLCMPQVQESGLAFHKGVITIK